VLRGGSLSSGANDLRASFRRGSLPGDEVINVGVRLRLSSPPQFRHLQPTATFTIKPTSTLTSIPTLLTPTPVLPTATFTPIPPTPPTPTLGTSSIYVNSVDGATYVYVPAGEFIMGSSDEQVNKAYDLCETYYGDCNLHVLKDSQPQQSVYLDSYWIMQTEVTNAQYRKFMDAGGYTIETYWSPEGWAWRTKNNVTEPEGYWTLPNFSGAEQPIMDVSWYEAEAYANWLSETSGIDFGLPTEAQWEKAARGTDGRSFPWGNQWDGSRANHCDKNCPDEWGDKESDDGTPQTAPAGSYSTGASPYGALDMVGNVWEWTADWYSYGYDEASPNNPTGPENGDTRVVRGGSWRSDPAQASATIRGRSWTPDNTLYTIGFRLVRRAEN